jgi:phosphoribosylaminoimidazole (AIR) synthetase
MPPAIEAVLATGLVADEDAWSTLNMGLGMCLVLPEAVVEPALATLPGAHRVGWIEPGPPGLRRA